MVKKLILAFASLLAGPLISRAIAWRFLRLQYSTVEIRVLPLGRPKWIAHTLGAFCAIGFVIAVYVLINSAVFGVVTIIGAVVLAVLIEMVFDNLRVRSSPLACAM